MGLARVPTCEPVMQAARKRVTFCCTSCWMFWLYCWTYQVGMLTDMARPRSKTLGGSCFRRAYPCGAASSRLRRAGGSLSIGQRGEEPPLIRIRPSREGGLNPPKSWRGDCEADTAYLARHLQRVRLPPPTAARVPTSARGTLFR